jgi:urease accessory protein
MRPALPRTALLCATVLLPALALAHGEAGDHAHTGFAAGFAHPFTGIDHLAAMLAVGLWSALHTQRPWLAPLSFASLLLIGALAGAVGLVPGAGAAEPIIAASLLAFGLLLVTRLSLSSGVGMCLVGGFALFHGLAHGSELTGAAALSGMMLATALLHAAGVLMGMTLRQTQLEGGRSGVALRMSVQAPRMAGAAVAALGAVLLASGWLA